MRDRERATRLRLAGQTGAVRALIEAHSAEDAVPRLLQRVCESLGWMVGEFWCPDAADEVLVLRGSWSDPVADVSAFTAAARRLAFRRGEGLPGRVWRSGEPAWVVDVSEDERFTRSREARDAGLRGGFAVPVPLDQSLHGVLAFFSREVLAPDPELLETMAAVGALLGQFLQRRATEAELRRSDDRFRAFAQAIPDAAFLLDAEGRLLYVNEAVRRIFGYDPGDLVGRSMRELLPEDRWEAHLERLRQVLAGSDPARGTELRIDAVRRDGSVVPLEIAYGTFRQDHEAYFTGIARDITDRRRAEQRLRFQARLLDAVGEAVIATDLAGTILYWNAYAETLYGWSSEEVVGRSIEEITPADVARPDAREIMQRLRRGEPWSGEFRVRDRAGREFPVLVSDSPILDEDGELIGIIGTSRDITARKRVERSNQFLAEAGRTLASSLDYGSTLQSTAELATPILGDWCLIHVVPPAGKRTAGALERVARVVPEPDDDAADRLEALASSGPPSLLDRALAAESPLLGPADGGAGALDPERLAELGIRSLLLVPLRARGEAVGVLTFAFRGTDQRHDPALIELAEELGRRTALAYENARLFREARQGDRAKTDFLAVVSHELRTPLNAIGGYAELLSTGVSGPLSDEQLRHVERIKVGAGHLAHLIDEILSFARVESGRENVELERVPVGRVAREAAVVIEPEASDKGLSIRVDAPEEGPEIVTDAGKVRQIVVNLLSNAVKYTESGEVSLAVRESPNGVTLVVRDTGIGIDSENLDRIFEPFWQAESPNTRAIGGTGLGLSVNRRLTELLGGEIDVESTPGEGSTFTVRLPDRPASEVERVDASGA